MTRHPLDQTREELGLKRPQSLFRPEYFRLVFFELRRDEALAAGDRLLARVVARHELEVRVGDLDVVAEHLVVAHLERCDPRASALACFEGGDPALAVVA